MTVDWKTFPADVIAKITDKVMLRVGSAGFNESGSVVARIQIYNGRRLWSGEVDLNKPRTKKNFANDCGDACQEAGEKVTAAEIRPGLEHLAATLPAHLRELEAQGRAGGDGAESAGGAASRSYALTDLGNADRLMDRHGEKLRYCDTWKSWLVWDKTHWLPDRVRDVETLAHETVVQMYLDALKIQDPDQQKALSKWALRSQSDKGITAMVNRARALDQFKVKPEQFDRAPWLFNVANGTIDLTTGELRPHQREDYLTQLCPVEHHPDAVAPLWEQFLLDIMAREGAPGPVPPARYRLLTYGE